MADPADTDRRIAREAAAPAVAACAPMGAEFMEARVRRAIASALVDILDADAEDRRTSPASRRAAERVAVGESAAATLRELVVRPPSLAHDASCTRPLDERRNGMPECAVGERRAVLVEVLDRDGVERAADEREAVDVELLPAAEEPADETALAMDNA